MTMERMRRFSIDDVRAVAEDLELLLRSNGISVTPGSSLERMTLSAYDALYQRQLRIPSGFGADIRPVYADLAALGELALQLLRVRNHRDFEQLLPHLALLNRGELSQNRPHSVLDDSSNKIFELYTACLMMRAGARITLEEPSVSASGTNPDVIADFPSDSWGVACKVLHSSKPQTMLNNIITGVKQIERATVDSGFVFLNLKNVIRHENYWQILNREEWEGGEEPVFSALVDWTATESMLKAEVESHIEAILAHVGSAAPIREIFAGKKALPCVLFYAHVMSGIIVGTHPAPMTFKLLSVLQVGPIEENDEDRFHRINHFVMDMPGPEKRPPAYS